MPSLIFQSSMHLAMERSLLCSSARFRPQLSSLPEKTLTLRLRAVFSHTNPSFRAGICCGVRDGPRKPLCRRRVLSKEAIQAVQALKLAKPSPSSPAAASAPGDGRMAEIFRSRIARLLKVDLLDVLKELQRQNEWEIALQVFDFIKKEVWYKPDSSLYTDMILMMGKNKLIENAEELLLELEKEGVRPDTRAFTEIIGAFLHIGDVQKAMSIYKLMKDSGCNPDKMTFTTLIRNLEKIGENDLATAVRGDYEQYVDYPEEFLKDLGKNYPKRRPVKLV